jgi:hypothetical protein
MRSEAPTLASDVGNLMHIHQGEHEAVEHGQHLGHRRPAHAAPILAPSVASRRKSEPIFHGPMRPDHLRQPLLSTALWRQRRPARDHLAAVLVTAAALAFDPKDLSHLAPLPTQLVVQIRTGRDPTPFQSAMSLLHLIRGLPGAPIRLRVFKKEFQVGAGGGRIVFDEQHHVPSRPFDQPSKLVIAASAASLVRMRPLHSTSVNNGLRVLTSLCSASNWTLLQHNAALHLRDMQDLLLWLLSSIELLAGAAQGFAINRHLLMLLTCLHR